MSAYCVDCTISGKGAYIKKLEKSGMLFSAVPLHLIRFPRDFRHVLEYIVGIKDSPSPQYLIQFLASSFLVIILLTVVLLNRFWKKSATVPVFPDLNLLSNLFRYWVDLYWVFD